MSTRRSSSQLDCFLKQAWSLIFCPPVIDVKLKDILSAEMLARYLVVGAAAVLVFYSETCLATADYKEDDQLLSREKRGSTAKLKLSSPLGLTCYLQGLPCHLLAWPP